MMNITENNASQDYKTINIIQEFLKHDKVQWFHLYTGFAKIKLVYLISVAVQASEGAATSFEGMLLSPLIHYRKAYCHGKSTRFDSCIYQKKKISQNCICYLYMKLMIFYFFPLTFFSRNVKLP